MADEREVLRQLVDAISSGRKSKHDAFVYAREYDRVHGTNLVERLEKELAKKETESTSSEE